MVAAWIKADTGVGPSMASGNQMCNGNMALLPAPPINISPRANGIIAPAAAKAPIAGVNENVSA